MFNKYACVRTSQYTKPFGGRLYSVHIQRIGRESIYYKRFSDSSIVRLNRVTSQMKQTKNDEIYKKYEVEKQCE